MKRRTSIAILIAASIFFGIGATARLHAVEIPRASWNQGGASLTCYGCRGSGWEHRNVRYAPVMRKGRQVGVTPILHGLHHRYHRVA